VLHAVDDQSCFCFFCSTDWLINVDVVQDDGNVHRSCGKRQPVCLLSTSDPMERQHLQADVQGDAHLLRPVCTAESDISIFTQ